MKGNEMSEQFRQDNPPSNDDLDVTGLLKKVLQQMSYLEKKLDLLLGQSSGAGARPSFNKERRFSKPFRPGGFGGGHSDRRPPSHGDRPRERSFDAGPARFDRPQGDKPRSGGGADRGRKAFFRKKTKFNQER